MDEVVSHPVTACTAGKILQVTGSVIHADRMFGEKRTKGRIIVKSPDTDVLVLCVHYFRSGQSDIPSEHIFSTVIGSLQTPARNKVSSADILRGD
jgi:hypothetical protein